MQTNNLTGNKSNRSRGMNGLMLIYHVEEEAGEGDSYYKGLLVRRKDTLISISSERYIRGEGLIKCSDIWVLKNCSARLHI